MSCMSYRIGSEEGSGSWLSKAWLLYHYMFISLPNWKSVIWFWFLGGEIEIISSEHTQCFPLGHGWLLGAQWGASTATHYGGGGCRWDGLAFNPCHPKALASEGKCLLETLGLFCFPCLQFHPLLTETKHNNSWGFLLWLTAKSYACFLAKES